MLPAFLGKGTLTFRYIYVTGRVTDLVLFTHYFSLMFRKTVQKSTILVEPVPLKEPGVRMEDRSITSYP